MSIRIGKGGGAPPPIEPAKTASNEKAGAASDAPAFKIRGKTEGEIEGAPHAAASRVDARLQTAVTPLSRLRAHEIDRDTYLNLKVEEATRHLVGLPPRDLETIRDNLRAELDADPALTDLVRAATSSASDPISDGASDRGRDE